jgi:hypothetical protein
MAAPAPQFTLANPNPDFLCPIKYDLMEFPIAPRCGHAVEWFELVRWIQTNNSCPTCRAPDLGKLQPLPEKDDDIQAFVLSELRRDPVPLQTRSIQYYLIAHPQLKLDPAIRDYLTEHDDINQAIAIRTQAIHTLTWARNSFKPPEGALPSPEIIGLMELGEKAAPDTSLRQLIDQVLAPQPVAENPEAEDRAWNDLVKLLNAELDKQFPPPPQQIIHVILHWFIANPVPAPVLRRQENDRPIEQINAAPVAPLMGVLERIGFALLVAGFIFGAICTVLAVLHIIFLFFDPITAQAIHELGVYFAFTGLFAFISSGIIILFSQVIR